MSQDPVLPSAKSLQDQLAVLAEITSAFSQTLGIEVTLRTGLQRIIEFMDVEAASVFLFDSRREVLVCQACAGAVDITGVRVPAEQGIVGEATQSMQSVMVRDVYSDSRFTPTVDEMSGFVSRSIMAAPLAVDELSLGAIEVINPRAGDGLFREEDRSTLTLLATAVALAVNNSRIAAELVDQERVRHELQLAREIQKGLLPEAPDADFPVHALNFPAREVSGDFFDFFTLADGAIGFALADVSGKGIDAALLGVKASTLLHYMALSGEDPARALSAVNEELLEQAQRGRFVTALMGVLSADRKEVRIANAGHPPPIRLKGTEARPIAEASGPPLGVMPAVTYRSDSFPLIDASLLVYSDGLSEATGAGGQELGVDGVRNRVAQMPEGDALFRLQWLADVALDQQGGQRDDVSVLLVQGGAAAPSVISLDASASVLASMRSELRQRLIALRINPDVMQDAVIAMNEACMNVIEHAYQETAGTMEISVRIDEGVLVMTLRDWAKPLDPASLKSRELDDIKPGGLGVHFIKTLMDDVSFESPAGGGNLVTMRKAL